MTTVRDDIINNCPPVAGHDGDGVVSADDADFAVLRVWQDVIANSLSEAGEMKTLAELDIESITVAAIASGEQVAGNLIGHVGAYTRQGQTGNNNATTINLKSKNAYLGLCVPMSLAKLARDDPRAIAADQAQKLKRILDA